MTAKLLAYHLKSPRVPLVYAYHSLRTTALDQRAACSLSTASVKSQVSAKPLCIQLNIAFSKTYKIKAVFLSNCSLLRS